MGTREELEEIVKNMQANEEVFEMMLRATSLQFFQRYSTLIEAGFNENAALQIVVARGIS